MPVFITFLCTRILDGDINQAVVPVSLDLCTPLLSGIKEINVLTKKIIKTNFEKPSGKLTKATAFVIT